MRILHALHGYPPEFRGGSELYVQRVAEAQVAAGHEVLVAAGTVQQGHDGFEPVESSGGIRLFLVSQNGLFAERWDHGAAPGVARAFGALLGREKPHVVHVHHWIRTTRALTRTAAELGISTVITAHDLYLTCPRVFRVRENEAFCTESLSVESCLGCVPRAPWMSDGVVELRLREFVRDVAGELDAAQAVIVPSRAHARVLGRFASLDADSFAVVPHAGHAVVRPGPATAWTAERRPLRIAHWGHLLDFKGVHVLLEALRGLDRADEFELVLWGHSDSARYADRLAELMDGLQVETNEDFTSGDLVKLDADLAVFPTLAHESYSFVLDEALSLELPVLVSDRGALPERCGEAGRSFSPGDSAELGGLIGGILDDPGVLARMKAAIPPAKTIEAHLHELDRVYGDVVGRKRKPKPRPLASELEESAALVRAVEARALELEGLRENASHDLANERAVHAELEDSVADYRGQIAEIEADLDNHRRHLAEVEADLESHVEALARAQSDYTTTEQYLIEAKAEIDALNERIAHQGAQIAERDAQIAERDAQIAERDAWLAERDAELRRLEEFVQDLDAQIARRAEALVDRETAIGRLRIELQRRADEARAVLAERNARLDEFAASVHEFEARVDELERHNRALERINRVAFPLTWPVRLMLRAWDRMRGRPY